MTDNNSPTDIEMDRLLTPGGHLSRAEQDEVAADLLHQLTSDSLAPTPAPWWKAPLPLGIASVLGAAAVLLVWVANPPAPAEFTARGANTQVQLRCNADAPAFFSVGEHTLSRCKGELEIHIVLPKGQETAATSLALVSDDDDLRWALPSSPRESSSPAPSAHSVVVAAKGDEQLILIKVEPAQTPRAALAETWGRKLETWKMPRASSTMRLVFESTLESSLTPNGGAP